MKTRCATIFVILIMLLFCNDVLAIWIDQVDIVPEQPTDADIITLNIFGTAGYSPSQVHHSLFSSNGTSLQLDLYVDQGFLTELSNWTYSTEIQPLPPAAYTLEVRAFDNYNGTLQDTYNVEFTIVPEPGTLAIFCVALPFFRAFSQRKWGLQRIKDKR